MAELQHILGAILRDISRARFTSDLYSRNISRFYEQEALLRRFPVPRAEIEEVDIEIKFAILNVEVDPGLREGIEARLAIAFERRCDAFTADFIDTTIDTIETNPEMPEDEEPWVSLLVELRSPQFRNDVLRRLLRYFEENRRLLVDREGNLDSDEAIRRVRDQLIRYLTSLTERLDLTQLQRSQMEFDVLTGVELESRMAILKEDVRAAVEEGGDYKLEVDVSAQGLESVPETAVASLRVQAVVRNYTWSLAEQVGGRVSRILGPE